MKIDLGFIFFILWLIFIIWVTIWTITMLRNSKKDTEMFKEKYAKHQKFMQNEGRKLIKLAKVINEMEDSEDKLKLEKIIVEGVNNEY